MFVYTQFEFACKLGKLDEVQRKSVISFPVMSKDMTNAENGSSISMKFFEITKEGRKLMREYLQTH